MADDVIEEDGRYRGFDVTDDDQSNDETDCNSKKNTRVESGCTCGTSDLCIANLETKLREQAVTIAKLKEELLKYNEESETTGNKKRKRGKEIEDVINAEMIADSADKDILIKELTDENENLKKKQTIENRTRKPPVEDKAIEARRSLPVPNVASIIEEMNTTITDRLAEIKDVVVSLIDEKLDRKLETVKQVSFSGKSYASTILGNTSATTSDDNAKDQISDPNVPNLRSIMMSQKNEELLEQNDRKNRARNFIIHGKKEESEDEDNKFVKAFLTQVGCENSILSSMKRIGMVKADKVRPILVQLNTEEEKTRIMSNLRSLKDVQLFIGISITDDYTLAEREMIKTYRMRAKELNDENVNTETVIRVRGCPKNGLFLKKIKKTISPMQRQENTEMVNQM